MSTRYRLPVQGPTNSKTLSTTTFTQAYFGRALDYVQVEAFDHRQVDAGVLVDIFLKFSGLSYNLSTANLKEALEEGLEEGGGLLEGSGTFLKVDPSRSYFLVTETQLQKQVPTSTSSFILCLLRWPLLT